MILHLQETHSTNQLLSEKMISEPLEEFTTIWADYQTSGRGQQGNHWESEPARNLCFSLLLRPTFVKAEESFLVSKAVALGITDTLNSLKEGFTIKWPNDIYYNNHKIAGVLIENQWQGDFMATSIVGIGLNVNQHQFLSNAPNPISLWQITGQEYPRQELLQQLLTDIYHRFEQLRAGAINALNQSYFERLYRREGYHNYIEASGAPFSARIVRVNNDGSILLQDNNLNTHSYYFKEVSIIL